MKISDVVKKTGINRSAVAACLKLFVPKDQSELTDTDVDLVVQIYNKSKAENLSYEAAYKRVFGVEDDTHKQTTTSASNSVIGNALGLQVQRKQAINFTKREALDTALAAHEAFPQFFAEAMAYIASSPDLSDRIEAPWAKLANEIHQDPNSAVEAFLLEGSSTFSSEPLLLTGSEEK